MGKQVVPVSEGFGHSHHTDIHQKPTVISVTLLGAGKEPVAAQGINPEQPRVQLWNCLMLFSHLAQKLLLQEKLHYKTLILNEFT